ncbi:MAG: acyl-CoA dehydrogenase family protein [Alphaproteobacteria bacterium]|nr:acyl-CoA dehydrogenase family protein [Alphaproteobacteria bacterium]
MAPDSGQALTTGADYVARAEALAPKISALAADMERQRRLLPEVLDGLHAAGLFRLLLPRSQNGGEVDPLTHFRVIETIARADASTAWCLGQGNGCAMSAAYLDPAAAWEVFGRDPRAVLAWGPDPKARAIADGDGYRVTGTWAFNSGGRHATWLGAHCPIYEADGTTRRLLPDGTRAERTMLVPASEVRWTDIWSVTGLRGTASDAYSLTDHFVRHDHSITRDFTIECREPGPLYRLSAMALYEVAFSGVALGIARASLDAFVDFARTKVPRGMKSPIRDNAVVQSGLAQAEVGIASARAHLLNVIDSIWQGVRAPDGSFTLDRRMAIRLASTHAIHRARDAVDFAYHAAGASAIFDGHPLERRFRDMHTVTQQLQGRMAHYETVGNWMMGGDPDLTFV